MVERKNLTIAFYPVKELSRHEFDYCDTKMQIQTLKQIKDKVVLAKIETSVDAIEDFIECFNSGFGFLEQDELDYVKSVINKLICVNDLGAFVENLGAFANDIDAFIDQYWATLIDIDFDTANKLIKEDGDINMLDNNQIEVSKWAILAPADELTNNDSKLYKAILDDIVSVTKGGKTIELCANSDGSYTLKYDGISKSFSVDE